MKIWKIKLTDTSDTTAFAAKEFERLIRKADSDARVIIADDGELKLGLCKNFLHPAVKDPSLDDAISIDLQNMKGQITGSNERSVLFAVYRLFVECGAVYVRPGRDGEIIPKMKSEDVTAAFASRARQDTSIS